MEHAKQTMERRAFRSFDTVNVVQAYPCDAEVLDEAERLCARYEKLFSHTDAESELNRINAAHGEPVEVSAELASLIEASLGYCTATDGLFDITMGPVVRLWDFKRGVVPSPEAVNEALAHVDYRNVLVDGRSVCLQDPDSAIVLGGIAKGYIADALLDLLRSRGVSSAVVNLGGNVAVMGGKPDGAPFSVGLRAPISSAKRSESYFAALPLRDGSVVTSGVYERAFEHDGEFFHHILDPRTGFPARSDIVSASVIARNSLDADGFSTALVIMGLDCAKDFIEARDGVEAVFMTAGGEVYATSGAAQFR